ncbi:tetratricopeptide repeat-containing sensor histidine kinase [Chryseobacterium koreense]|uniref:tetratricopeptide repeat-containing sensor histidine kinase n=1 Tax=Chryseobacterium koreense TaxID=232216 RepID=UPI00065AF28E|nr:tetratricopeptide repeat-containing sensor histidine kinase [Chryseobacterium koreense]MBB5334683.1 signal transduction histidine kinase [Chryseobacterium koreense]
MKLTKNYYLIVLFIILSCSEKENTNHTNPNYEKAWHFFENGNETEAFKYFAIAKNDFLQNNDSIGVGKSLMNGSIILLNAGDYFGSEESNIQALKYLKNADDHEYVFSVYNSIAISRKKLKDYKSALAWYEKALEASRDSLEKTKIRNNIAVALSKSKEYDKAIAVLEDLAHQPEYHQDLNTQSKIRDNLAFTKFLQNPNHNAEPELKQALSIRENENDLWGQNASHAHLSDYFYEKDKLKSLFHAQKMLEIASDLRSPDDQLEALQKLALLESSDRAKKYFLQYQKLNDSVQTARAIAKNQFALIRYGTEKEKAENARKQNHILKQNIAIGVLAISLLGGFIVYKKRKKGLQQEKEIEVKNTQLKYSRKVHDIIANGLYHTMVEIQNNAEFNKENILNRIEKMYEDSRDIARDDLMEVAEKEFAARLSEMIYSYQSSDQKVFVVENDQEKWHGISPAVQSEIYYVLREAMVNMVKHSRASLTSVKIERSGNNLSVKYTDNGIGIEDREKISASGIRNMENRIEAIRGKVIFGKNPKGGLTINISVPIH